jgi:glycosyltransferase involved in cell wall biosynthesis
MVQISVVMPTYNTPVDILREAVESILWQTFRDFEFIIIDDGSTNDSVDYLNRLEDKRIRLIRNPENISITKSLNISFRAAQGKTLLVWIAMTFLYPPTLKNSMCLWSVTRM